MTLGLDEIVLNTEMVVSYREVSTFIKVFKLFEWSLKRAYEQSKKPLGNCQKWSRSLAGAFNY